MIKLPNNFIQAQKISFCGNSIANTGIVLSFNDDYILAVGKTDTKHKLGIWLSAINYIAAKNEFEVIHIVENSKQVHPSAKVFDINNDVSILVNGQLVLEAHFDDDETCNIKMINLKSIGMAIDGKESSSLTIGGANFSNNNLILSPGASAFALGV